MSTPGVFSTVKDTMSTAGGYHNECGDTMSIAGVFSTLGFPYKFNCFPNDFPHIYHDIPWCTHDIPPVYS